MSVNIEQSLSGYGPINDSYPAPGYGAGKITIGIVAGCAVRAGCRLGIACWGAANKPDVIAAPPAPDATIIVAMVSICTLLIEASPVLDGETGVEQRRY
jgi:hypothetical protein